MFQETMILHIRKAYIPLEQKTSRIGGLRWSIPPMKNFALGIPTCWYLKTLTFALPPMRPLKFAFPLTQNPNASHWNVARIGFPGIKAWVGHVHFMLFVPILFALGSQHEHSFQ